MHTESPTRPSKSESFEELIFPSIPFLLSPPPLSTPDCTGLEIPATCFTGHLRLRRVGGEWHNFHCGCQDGTWKAILHSSGLVLQQDSLVLQSETSAGQITLYFLIISNSYNIIRCFCVKKFFSFLLFLLAKDLPPKNGGESIKIGGELEWELNEEISVLLHLFYYNNNKTMLLSKMNLNKFIFGIPFGR